MKIAVATEIGGLEDVVSPVFGRCRTFTIVETDRRDVKKVDVVSNASAQAMRGAGIQAAQTLVNLGVNAVIAGNFGPNAFNVLNQAGVALYMGAGMRVKDAVKALLNGSLQGITSSGQPGFYGPGMGMGRGMGRGRGAGRRRWQY